MLAREVGASWDEVLGSIMLTLPGFGLLPAVEAIPHARTGFDAAPEPEADGDEEPDCMSDAPFRILPRVTDRNRHFWTGGADGELRFLRCQDDGTYVHPPTPRCPECWARTSRPKRCRASATVHTFTVNHQPWMPGPELPFVLAIVELPEQAGLRLTTNIVNCDPEKVTVGMPVRVTFEAHVDGDETVYIPLFEPAAS